MENFYTVFFQFKNIHAGFLGMPFDGKTEKCLAVLPEGTWNTIVQIHGDTLIDASLDQQQADGMYTHKKNIGCTVLTADCIGALFYNENNQEIAAIHAGWRGLAQKIFTKYLEKFDTLSNIHVALSPSLGKCCAEFSDPFRETPDFFHPFVETRKNKYFVDLWGIAKKELLQCGILEKNIEMPPQCTKCGEGFWSHRRGDAQRNISYIVRTV